MRIITITTASALALGAVTAPAAASDRGLYGSQDPTFDGVYRQSLALLALAQTGQKLPEDSVAWLVRQQCSDGGYQSYRADTSAACQPPDTTTYTGEDTNSTALAVAALTAAGKTKPAKRAVSWLKRKQNADNGWAWFPTATATSDSASTGLVLGALKVAGAKGSQKYLRANQLRCEAEGAQRGALPYDTSTPGVPSDSATAQVAWAMFGGLTLQAPARKISPSYRKFRCAGDKPSPAMNLSQGARAFLAGALIAHRGGLPNGVGGVDYAGTAGAVIALADAGEGGKAVKRGMGYLRSNSAKWVQEDGADKPGPLALILMAEHATAGRHSTLPAPQKKLLRRLQATRTR